MTRLRKAASSQQPPEGAVSQRVTVQKSGMGRLRRFNLCRSRMGSIFVVVLIAGLILFIINYFQGFSHFSDNSVARDNDYDMGPPGGGWRLKDQLLGVQRNGRRKKFRFDDDDDDPLICKVPKLSLHSDANTHAFHKMPPLNCNSTSNLMYVRNGVLHINETVLNGRKLEKCEYYIVEWINDYYTRYAEPVTQTEEPFTMKIKHDFFRVHCYLAKSPREQNADVAQGRMLLQVDENEKLVADKIPDKPDLNRRAETFENLKQFAGKKAASVEQKLVQMHKSVEPRDDNPKEQPRMMGSMGLPDPPVMKSIKTEVNLPKADQKSPIDEEVQPGKSQNQAAHANPGPAAISGKKVVQDDVPQRFLQAVPPHQVQQDQVVMEGDQNKAREDLPEEHEEKHEKVNQNNDELDEAEDISLTDDYYPYSDFNEENNADFDQFVAQIYPPKSILERLNEMKPKPESLQMNVLILVLDSMSHLSYQRKLPKTYEYLRDELDAVILNGYNIVGDATTAAMIPLLTGKNESQLPEVRKSVLSSTYVDSYPLIWNKFEQSGYVTFYAEDDPAISTFNLRFNGFEQPPTDHYMRSFWLASQDSDLYSKSMTYCLGGMPKHRYLLDYVRQFFMRYREHPRFALAFLNSLSHYDNNPSEYADEDIVKLLEFLRKTKNLDNTLLIVMADHGARYSKVRGTVQGKMEERLPMMSLTFPTWFEKKYDHLMRNLRRNVDRLTTPYDVHETIRNILYFKNMENVDMDHTSRGISLLKEIPLNRTCASAHIDMHWCTCMQWKEMKHDNYDVIQSIKATLNFINRFTEDYRDQCEVLTLKNVIEAKLIMPNEKVLTYLKNPDPDQHIANFSRIDDVRLDIVHYQVILETSPNDGMYEATILADHKAGTFKLTEEPSRINVYGEQPACIMKKHPELRKYCMCKHRPKKRTKAL